MDPVPWPSLVLWLYEEHMTLEFADETLAEYTVSYQKDRQHLRSVTSSRFYATRFQSPQLPLLELAPDDWLLAIELPTRRRRRARRTLIQASLFSPDDVASSR
jgi:hypothetical protein